MVGIYRLRLATDAGITNFRPFCVDGMPEVAGSGENHSVATAQLISATCVVTGRVDAETSASYYQDFRRGRATNKLRGPGPAVGQRTRPDPTITRFRRPGIAWRVLR